MQPDITALLGLRRSGDAVAGDELVRAVYPLLRKPTQAQLSRVGGDPTLQATELVHEAHERLQMQSRVEWKDRSLFMAISAADSTPNRNTLLEAFGEDLVRGAAALLLARRAFA